MAYISGWVGLMTNDEAGKLYSATTSPRKPWALCATSEPLSQQMSPRTSRVGKQSITFFVLISRSLKCRSDLIWERMCPNWSIEILRNTRKIVRSAGPAALPTTDDALRLTRRHHRLINAGWSLSRRSEYKKVSSVLSTTPG